MKEREKKSGKQLVIVESPAKAKTISHLLDNDYRVEASYGHVRDLPENAKQVPSRYKKIPWATLGVDIEHDFAPLYIIPPDKQKYVKRLKEAVQEANTILLATDEDREGESISWHILQVVSPPKDVTVKRIVFHEITRDAILEAMANPRGIDENLVKAQEARRILDRLYGYLISPILWRSVTRGLSAGRVQSVAVRLCVERERERMAFRSATYWDLLAELDSGKGTFKARLIRLGDRRIADGNSFDPKTGTLKDTNRIHLLEEKAKELAQAALNSSPWKVTLLEKKPASKSPAPPFTTSTLQQEANRKLKLSSQRTMQIAQQLYEGVDLDGERIGLITYMRTDSVTLSEKAIQQARNLIKNMYGNEFCPETPIRYQTKAKHAQEAHEAIRPTDLTRLPQDVKKYLTDEQFKIYELIWKRTIACQMVPAEFENTNVEVTVNVNGQPLVFYATGRRIVFPGFLRAYVEGSDEPEAELSDSESLLPELHLDQTLLPIQVVAESHKTKPPMRYTEASLIKKLEEEGIGRPSTYATIVSTIQDRGYIFKRGNELVPTFTAFCVTDLLEKKFMDLVDVAFTARMEEALDEVAEGEQSSVDILRAFYYGEKNQPGLAKRIENGEPYYPSVTIGNDPKTGEPLIVKVGKYGPYLQRGSGESRDMVSIPPTTPPDELTPEKASELLEKKSRSGETITVEVGTGRRVVRRHGRYGDYLEISQTDEERSSGQKPKRFSLPKGIHADDLTEEQIQNILRLPRQLGLHPEDNEPVIATIGPYGAYVKHGNEYRNLDSWERAFDITFEEALELLKEPKRKRAWKKSPTVLKDFGEVEGANGVVKILRGKYGDYVTDGTVNASLPKGSTAENISAEQAVNLLEQKRKKQTA
ncbi:MAG TPA: type I DNA topoisomerase [Fimbriimonadales bacterium]|nr:type I DNA topoisomerase [Fimbriimonadales bacterium]